MAAILLDVDGVLHISGRPINGAAHAVKQLRDAGHRIRFLTNNTTQSRVEPGTLAAHPAVMLHPLQFDAAQRVIDERIVLAPKLPTMHVSE